MPSAPQIQQTGKVSVFDRPGVKQHARPTGGRRATASGGHNYPGDGHHRGAAVAADAAEKIASRDANALAAQKIDVTNAAAAAHAAAAFLSGSRFRALLKANEQLRGALATKEAQRAAAAKRVDVQKRADASTRDALETATKRQR